MSLVADALETVRVAPPGLDDMLTLDEAAAWLRLSRLIVLKRSRGRRPLIPSLRPNARLIRYHPRTILAKFAADAGVPVEVIAASYGLNETPKGDPNFNPLATNTTPLA